MWSYCVCGLGSAPHARELPLVLFHGQPLDVPSGSAIFPVPDHPRLSVVLSAVIIIDHNGLFDLDLDVQITGRRRIGTVLGRVELGPHGVGDVARSGDLVSDDNSPLSTLLSGLCESKMR